MFSLKARTLWAATKATPLSFKLLCLYVLFEYVRPQSIYSFLSGPPWPLISLGAAIAAFLAEGRRPGIPRPIALALVAFTAVMLASSVAGYQPSASVKDLKVYANWLILIVLVSGLVGTERRWFLFLLMYLAFCLKMSQHGFLAWASRGFSFTSWGVTGGPNWFANSGEFALQMSMFVPAATYYILATRKHLSKTKRLLILFLPISAVGSIIASSSRGGMLALVMVAFIAAIRSNYRVRTTLAFAVGVPLLWLVVPPEFKKRFDTAGSDDTSVIRLRYWTRGMEIAGRHPLLGVGQGSWESYYRDHYVVSGDSLNRFDGRGQVIVQPAHNSFVEVAAQLGYLGLALFLLLIGSCFWVNLQTRRIAIRLGQRGRFLMLSSRGLDDGMIAFCIAGFFMSVAYYPFVWMQIALTAGLHGATRDALREHTKSLPSLDVTSPDRTAATSNVGSRAQRRFRGGAGRLSSGSRVMPRTV